MNKLELKDIDFIYPKSANIILKDIKIKFEEKTVTSIIGQSGAGKSTLLYLISGFTKPNNGVVVWNGKAVTNLDDYRRNIVGTISQSYLLFPSRTVLENVEYPILLKGTGKVEAKNRAKELLEQVGIDSINFRKLPEKLSGGEQQRVAIARCLAADSIVIVADEPTGNLDQENTEQIFKLFKDLAYNKNKIVIIVTHDKNLAKKADKQYELRDSKLIELT